MFLAAYYWGFSFIEVQGPHKRCKGLWCVQGPHLLPIYLYILRIINMIWCKGLNERCKGLNEWCKGRNEWCKGLWCVQGPHIMPFYLITNDNQYGGSAPWHLVTYEKGGKEQVDLFSLSLGMSNCKTCIHIEKKGQENPWQSPIQLLIRLNVA